MSIKPLEFDEIEKPGIRHHEGIENEEGRVE